MERAALKRFAGIVAFAALALAGAADAMTVERIADLSRSVGFGSTTWTAMAVPTSSGSVATARSRPGS
jgi:hypothetical protein